MTRVAAASASTLVTLLALGAGPAPCQETPPPDQVWIKGISYAGHCSAGSVTVSLAPDAGSFRLGMGGIRAFMGPGTSLMHSRKNCQINVALQKPEGFTVAIDAIDYAGEAELPAHVRAFHRVMHYFAGGPPIATPYTTILDPFFGPWEHHRETDPAELAYFTCLSSYASFDFTVVVRLQPPASGERPESFIELTSGPNVRLQWKRCAGS